MQPPGAGHNSKSNIHFEVVTTAQQWLHASAIRSICFIEEHNATVDWLFDGNDYMATHFVAYDGLEPVGAARVRWFKDFAKIERTCFRKSHRSVHVLKSCSANLFDHIAHKGYTRVITHASEKYVRLWRAILGFQISDKPPAHFEGHEPYYEIWKDLEPVADAITLETSCTVLYRTEGKWHEPSAAEA